MENKLPNPYEFFIGAMLKTNAKLNNKIPEQNMIDAFKEYGRQVRDYALEVASENAECESGAIIDMGFEIISASVNKDSILNLKNSKELEI